MTRESLVAFASKLPACIVAMEACCGAHFLGRTFAAQGHTVRLMSPEYVQPYVKSQKTDDRDAEAIAEAATRPTMRPRPEASGCSPSWSQGSASPIRPRVAVAG